jgi:chromatin remodeling complex protein RSC6
VAAKKTAAAAVVEAPKVVEAAKAPEAQAVAAAVEIPKVVDEIASLTKQLNDVKETLRKALTALKTIEKRHGQELKEAKKRRRVKKETDGEAKPARPSVFTTPVLLKDGLAVFLGKEKGTKMSPADVTRAVKIYIDEHKLKGEKHEIHPDARMCEVLGLKAGETLTYKNIQKYLYQQYIKEVKPTA